MAQDSGHVVVPVAGAAALAPSTQSAPAISPAAADSTVPAAAQFHPAQKFDPVAATNAYLATLPAEQKAKSDAYFEGGYWIGLWGFLISAVIMLILLRTGLSRKMRDRAERTTRFNPIRTFLYWVQFSLILYVLSYPWNVYTSYIREHQYGLATQGFAGWMGDEGKALLLSIVLG